MHPGGRPTENKRPELGERIAKARERAGLSQYDLARELGVAQQQVVSWERKVNALRSDSLARVAQVLKVSTDELLGIVPVKETLPRGKSLRLFEEISKLPRRQQERILENLADAVEGAKRRNELKAS